MAENEKLTLKVETTTWADKIEPIESKTELRLVGPLDELSKTTVSVAQSSTSFTDAWKKLAAVGGRQNGKTYAQQALYAAALQPPTQPTLKDLERQMKVDYKSYIEEQEKKAKMNEKWIWIEGYKGTDANMRCRDFQFELNKMYSAEEGTGVTMCQSGFHLCLNLKDVFKYYEVGKGNRFFKVRALVRQKDYDACVIPHGLWSMCENKLTSMSIEFISELTPDEILKAYDKTIDISKMSDEDKTAALKKNPKDVVQAIKIKELVELGYSLPFASFVVEKNSCDVAKAVASQPGLSMDMKAMFILKDIWG